MLRGRTPVVVNVDSAREDDNEYEGHDSREDHHGGVPCTYIESSAFVRDEYSAIESDESELDEAIASHGHELIGEFELQTIELYVHEVKFFSAHLAHSYWNQENIVKYVFLHCEICWIRRSRIAKGVRSRSRILRSVLTLDSFGKSTCLQRSIFLFQ